MKHILIFSLLLFVMLPAAMVQAASRSPLASELNEFVPLSLYRSMHAV